MKKTLFVLSFALLTACYEGLEEEPQMPEQPSEETDIPTCVAEVVDVVSECAPVYHGCVDGYTVCQDPVQKTVDCLFEEVEPREGEPEWNRLVYELSWEYSTRDWVKEEEGEGVTIVSQPLPSALSSTNMPTQFVWDDCEQAG